MLRSNLEYESACWDQCRGQISALDQVQNKAAQFTNHTNYSDCETLDQRRTIARLCALFRVYIGERSWKAIRDTLRRSWYLSRVDHVPKFMDRKHRTDIEKYSFVNGTIKNRNQLPDEKLRLSLLNLRFLETELGKQL